jgi:ABC-type nitrate/sulfonate/bicarbonate transport system substrate-binding protein
MSKSRHNVAIVLAIAAATLVGQSANAAETVRLFTARPGWQTISAWYATDLGLWTKHNVDVKHVSLDSSSSVMEAFISGQADMAVAIVGESVNAFFRGVPLRIVAGTPASDYPAVTFSPNITGLADLKGKKVAVWSIPNDATLAFDTQAKMHDLASGRDFTYVRVPNQNICDTLERGQADVGIMFEPYASACLLRKAKRIAPSGTISFDPPKLVASSVVIVNSSFLEKNRETVKAVLRAMNESIDWAAKNKPQAVDGLAKHSGAPKDAIALSYDSANFGMTIDRGYHDILLNRYREIGLIQRSPTDADMKTLYQTDIVQR